MNIKIIKESESPTPCRFNESFNNTVASKHQLHFRQVCWFGNLRISRQITHTWTDPFWDTLERWQAWRWYLWCFQVYSPSQLNKKKWQLKEKYSDRKIQNSSFICSSAVPEIFYRINTLKQMCAKTDRIEKRHCFRWYRLRWDLYSFRECERIQHVMTNYSLS